MGTYYIPTTSLPTSPWSSAISDHRSGYLHCGNPLSSGALFSFDYSYINSYYPRYLIHMLNVALLQEDTDTRTGHELAPNRPSCACLLARHVVER